MKERVKKLMEKLTEDKTGIDLAFIMIQAKISFLDENGYFDTRKKEGQKWLDLAISEYKETKCKGCCEQEAEDCSA